MADSVTQAYSRLAAVYDEIVADPCHDGWADYLLELWRSDPCGVRTVLDVCCGTGMMTDALQKRGLRVVGVDASAAMLARARARLGESTVLIQQRLPDLSVDGVFDAAVSTFDGLNYLSPADFSSAISALRDKLRPGGWLAFDLHTSAMMEFTRLNPIVRGEIDGMRFVISSEVDVDSRTCDSRIDLTRVCDGDAFSECHRQYFVTDAEVGAALDDAGLLVVGVGDEYTHTQVDAATLRATWVARNRGGTAGDEHG